MGNLPATMTLRVVGVSFAPGYPENLHRLSAVAEEARHKGEGLAAVLVREPDNAYDANAVAVHVPSVGHIGHVSRDVAAKLAPDLDAGEHFQTHVAEVLIHPDNPANSGITLRLERVQ